jgi:hypothetical protein
MRLIDSNKLHRKSRSSKLPTQPLLGATYRKSGQADSGRLESREQANARSHLAASYVQFFSLTRNIMSFILCR